MKTRPLRLVSMFILMSMALQGGKKPPARPNQVAAKTAPEPQAVAATPVLVSVPERPFDFTTIPEVQGSIPPFPYVDYPPTLPVGLRMAITYPMDEVDVILGWQLHRLEGRITMRRFAHREAQMSAAEVRRSYQEQLRGFGAVKVNDDEEDAHYCADQCMAKLRAPYYDMSYDVYLARTGTARHWIVLMTGESATRMLSIEELPFIQTIGYEGRFGSAQAVTATGTAPAAPQPLAIASLPMNMTSLPYFPYLPFPDEVPVDYRKVNHASVDTASFIVGKQLHTVEGRVRQHVADGDPAQLRSGHGADVQR